MVTGVANKLGVKKPSAIQMVNGLMQSGYLIKKNSETDKRVFSLELSEKGFKMMRLEEAFSNEFLHLFYDSLTTDEIELLEKITEKIASKIETVNV